MASDDGYLRDDWPKMPDNTDYDGKELLALVRAGNSPFKDMCDVNLLVREVENNVGAQVADIPFVSKGSNNYVSICINVSIPVTTFPRLRAVGQNTGLPLGDVGQTEPPSAFSSR